MVQRWRRGLAWVAIALLSPVACFYGLRAINPPLVRTAGMAGEVSCVNGMPQATSDPALQGQQRDENLLHESRHVEQYRADCVATARRWRTDPLFRLQLESVAWCYGMQVYQDLGYILGRRNEEAQLLVAIYGVSYPDVRAALDSACGARPENVGPPRVWVNMGHDSAGRTVSTQPKQVLEPGIPQ